ncbi:MAG: tetratricopeptide repeat protein [Candidatus Eisenbacteria bacterium]|nr:tetratricopeptide repeat protein [Candidatus Eisenbacteria bacterium]
MQGWMRAFCGIGVSILALGFWVGCARELPEPDWSAPEIAGSELIVAEVGSEPITAGELYHKIRLQYPRMPNEGPSLGLQAREILKQSVVEHCYEKLAEERDYEQNADYRRLLALSRLHLIGRVIGEEEVDKKVAPSDEELRAMYAADSARWVVPAQAWYRHILCDSQTEARMVLAQLESGADFEALAAEASRDEVTADKGGKMPPAQANGLAGHLGRLPELTAAVLAIEEGEYGGPIRTEKGWHVVKVDHQRAEMMRSFDEVRAELRRKQVAQQESRRFEALIDSLKQAYDVRYLDENMERFYLLQCDAEQLFTAAQSQQDAAAKVRIYEHLLERFPESDRCPEALFMIGFERAERLNDPAGAIAAFEQFLQDYPTHEMASSAQLMLDELRDEP